MLKKQTTSIFVSGKFQNLLTTVTTNRTATPLELLNIQDGRVYLSPDGYYKNKSLKYAIY